MIRVLIADDSSTARVLLRGILESDPQIRVVGEATNGAEAVEMARRVRPGLITMDVNMPVMDGLEATKQIMMSAPTPIIIVSAIERAALDLSFDATQAGALIVVKKPVGPGDARYLLDRDQLLGMVKAMAQVKVVRRWGAPATSLPQPRVRQTPADGQLVVIGTSTGGPAALRRLLADLPPDFPAPVLVVQHIARGFVGGLASWLEGGSRLPVRVAEEREQLRRGTVLLAPDDRHLGVTRAGRVELSDAPPISGFRPSVTHLFRSAAQAYGPGVIALLLTGMGSDGVDGLRDVRELGGRILAQDAETSVVYGMAQEAVRAGLCSTLLPLERIGEHLADLVA
jgi:two-component system, chemotaxis family, protein-glutamate methylesterase/glutaminase